MSVVRGDEITVLYVGDEPEIAADQLEHETERIIVQTATSVSDGFERIAESDIDCVLAPYEMPEGTGIDFLETVRDNWPNLPFVLLVGTDSESVVGDAVNAGATDYFRRNTDQYGFLANRIVNAVESHRVAESRDGGERHTGNVAQEPRDLSLDLLKPEGDGVDELINNALEKIGTLANADRSYVFQFDDESDTLSNTHEWVREGVDHQMDNLQNIDPDALPWWMEQLEQFETISIPDLTDLPADAAVEREMLEEQNVTSLVAVPMVFDEAIVGFIGFDWVSDQENRSEEFVDILWVAGQLITVLLRREFRRRELERREAYLEQSSDIISVMDADGTVKYQSKSTERVTGFSPENVIGKSGLKHIHPEDRPELTAEFSSFVAQPNEVVTAEMRVRTADESWRWIEVRGVNKLEDPLIEGLVFSSRDITGRKEREREIKHLNERLELAVEGAELGVWDWDMTTDEVEFNEQWAEMLGYSLDEIEPHLDAWENRVHPEDFETVEAALDAHIEGETELYDTEHRMQSADGEWKWIRDVGRVVEQDEQGDPVRAVGIHLDIDERKERETELQQFREAVERTAHAVYITDTDGTIEYVNPAFETMTGYSEDDALGRTPRILKSDEYDDQYYEEFWETITSGQKWEQEMIDRRADGDRIVFDQSITPLLDKDGEPRKFVAVAQNITELKQYEQELETQRDNLEALNQIVRHDIRNNLQVVSAYAETLERHVEDPAEEYVANILEASHSAIEMTETARDVTRVMLQSESDLSPVDLQRVLEGEIDDIRSHYGSALVTIDGSIPSVVVQADEMLESVFRNVLGNAIQHNDKEIPEIIVSATVDDSTAKVRIADNGPGISDDRKQEIFEEGEQGIGSNGTGLGLYLVDTLMERYGGDVHVEDNEPDGSVFVVTLQIAD